MLMRCGEEPRDDEFDNDRRWAHELLDREAVLEECLHSSSEREASTRQSRCASPDGRDQSLAPKGKIALGTGESRGVVIAAPLVAFAAFFFLGARFFTVDSGLPPQQVTSAASPIQAAPEARPSAEAYFTAVPRDGTTDTVDLTWSADPPATNGYILERRSGNAAFTQIATPAAGATTAVHTGGSAGTLYFYRLTGKGAHNLTTSVI